MSLRLRFAIVAALAAALAIVGVAVVGIGVTRWRLRTEVDRSLRSQALEIAGSPLVNSLDDGARRPANPDRLARRAAPYLQGGLGAFQVIDADGNVIVGPQYVAPLGVDDVDRGVAAGARPFALRDRDDNGRHLRIATVAASPGIAVQLARPIDDIDRTIRSLLLVFSVIGLAGVAISGGIGFVVAGKALDPVKRLGAAAEEVARRQDPTLPVPETGGAELVSLGRSINLMLASLDDARRHERRLIDDAAHELRTPLTSLRTNIEVLTSGRLPEGADHDALLADVRSQVEEFSELVADLDALARRETTGQPLQCVQLGEIVTAAVRRAQRRAGPVTINTTIDDPGQVMGDEASLERAALNVIDNAVKWSPPDGKVEVRVRRHLIEVADNGPGIAPEDRPFVFDRFWRAPSARSMRGSGLGMAIVADAVNAHHGTVTIDANPEGGTLVRIDLAPGTSGR